MSRNNDDYNACDDDYYRNGSNDNRNDSYDDGYDDQENGYDDSRDDYRDYDYRDDYHDDYRDSEPAHRPQRGQRDIDWADDLVTRADGRIRDNSGRGASSRRRNRYDSGYDGYDGNDAYPEATRRRQAPRRPEKPSRQGRSNEYDSDNMTAQRKDSFRRRHPVLMNVIYILASTIVLFWLLLCFLDFWTFHGEERVVPDVKGQTFDTAAGNIDISGLTAVISDSVFDSYSSPGTVVEQTPIAGARIKKGGNVYLTIVAFSPKLVTVPDFYNASVRQARSMFEGLGIKEIREVPVVSEYAGLVLGARFNGVALQPGARIPVSAVVTIEVGTGYDPTEETGADIDSLAIDNVIDELNIE